MKKIKKWIEEKIGMATFCVVIMAIILVSISTVIYLNQINNYTSTGYESYGDGINVSTGDLFIYVDPGFFSNQTITLDPYLSIGHYYNSSNNTFNIYGENNTLVFSGLYSDIENMTLDLNMTFRQFMYLTNSWSEPKTDVKDVYAQIFEQVKIFVEGGS